ncbi:hypothetical protein BaRGS_00016986 [Batillaria attramentaria]|uniref:Uncharacterized protein n=1 Tax=Batillaria attramentaria TaxID=370345 RepID=A0ABD0KXG5_9CAEN
MHGTGSRRFLVVEFAQRTLLVTEWPCLQESNIEAEPQPDVTRNNIIFWSEMEDCVVSVAPGTKMANSWLGFAITDHHTDVCLVVIGKNLWSKKGKMPFV